jgi:hypothetical protein
MLAFVVAVLAVCVGVLLAMQDGPHTERLSRVVVAVGALTTTAWLAQAVGGWVLG